MQLPPEVTRLRRMARACAAGEVSRRDFRKARRNVIAKYAAANVDKTERRAADATVPRMAKTRRTDVEAAKPPWWWLAIGLLACAALLPVVGWSAQIIAPANERDPDPMRAQRLEVNQITWKVSDPVPSIDSAAAQEVLAAALVDQRTQSAVGDHGFTDSELVQVARFLDALGIHDERRLNAEDVRDLQALVERQKHQRGINVNQLESIAKRLQQWLRAQGYPLATAYVPGQVVEDGIVYVNVEVGRLSEIVQAGSDAELASPLANSLEHLVGQPVRRTEFETRLNVINGYTLDSVQAQFRPGANVGDSAMVLHVDEGPAWRGYVQVDNYGQTSVGEERLSAGMVAGDLVRQGDQIQAQIASSIDSADQIFGNIGYLLPIDPGRRLLKSRVGFTDIQGDDVLGGEGIYVETKLSDTHVFTRRLKRQLEYGIGLHRVDMDDGGDQKAAFGEVNLLGHRLWDEQKFALQGSVGLKMGHMQTSGASGDGWFWQLHGQALAWTPVELPWLEVPSKLVLEGRAQMVGDRVPATMRFAGASPYFNPGLAVGDLVVDEAIGVSASLRFNAPYGEWWTFSDITYGETGATWYELVSVGLGWEAPLWQNDANQLSSRLTVGYPVTHGSNGDLDDDGLQIYWSLRLRR